MHKSAGTCDWFMPAPINQSIVCGPFSHSALFTNLHECLLYFWHHLFSTTSSIFSLIKMACMHISQFFLFLPGLFFLLLWSFPSCGDLRCEQTHAHPETNTVSLCVWPPYRVHHWIAWARVTISASARMCRVNAWPVFCPQWFFPLSLLHVSGLCKNTYALLSPIFLQSVLSRSLPPPSPISFCVHLPSHLFEAGRCERNTCLTCKGWGTAVSVPCVCLHEGVCVLLGRFGDGA